MPEKINNRMRFTRQTIVSNTYYQMPRFLTAGEFAGNSVSNNARILYTLLLDRHRLSVKNGWFDDNGEVYIYFKREEMEAQIGLSKVTIIKVMQELKDLFLVEEKKQGFNKPNKIYLLSPIIGNDENPEPYLDPDSNYNPEITPDYVYDSGHIENDTTGDIHSILPARQELNPRTLNNYTAGSIEAEPPKVQNMYPNKNKLINNKKKNNYMSDNEVSKTAAAIGGAVDPPTAAAEAEHTNHTSLSIPYSQILDLYNRLCETHGLRPIRSINGKRKTQTAARFKEYGLSGFFDLFNKTAASGFLCGGGERGWKADFDWLTAPTNMQKVLEGKYDDNQSNTPYLRVETSYTPSQNKIERQDPFLERALTAYETAKQATG